MDGFRFILENPHPNASHNKQRKRARLVTACDSCRVKKIKCQQPVPNGRCDACRVAKTPCLFGDRDRYQAERGVTCTWSTPVDEHPVLAVSSPRKRKLNAVPYPRASSSVQSRSATPAGGNVPLFDPNRPRFPHPWRMRQLGYLFFDHLGAVFPFLDRYEVLHRIEQQTCSAILSNCIAALALRYVAPASAPAAPFYDMAKSLASYVVSVPSVEALHALICLTWAEYGSGGDDGFAIYSRMAIAMCLDLGLGCEMTIQVAATPEVRHRLRLTWWSVVCTADIAPSWLSARPATLDLDQYDTRLPEPTDDPSLLFRNIAELYVLRAKLNRVLDAHLDNRGDSSLDWDLSKLQTTLESISDALPPAMVFSEHNLLRMRDRGIAHSFVHMHLLIHAVSALLNRPSLLPCYGLPVPTEGPRADAARTRAKTVVDMLITVESVAPESLCDPFMDLPVLVASLTFIADAAACALASHSPLLDKCKECLVRLSATWGGAATLETALDQHAGLVADAFTIPASNSTNNQWLVLPHLLDDEASDSSRSSSRELSPLLIPSSTTGAKYHAFNVGGSPLVHEVDDKASFFPLDLVMPGTSLGPEEDMFGYFDEQQLLNVEMWREDETDFSPLYWANQYLT